MSTVITKNTGASLAGIGPQVEVSEKDAQTRGGVQGQNGPVPDANNTALTLAVAMSLQSFTPSGFGGNFASSGFGTDFETRLAEVADKLKATTGEAEKARVNNEMETKKLNIQENQTRMEEAQTKMEEAEAAAKVGDIFTKIGIAFQYLGAILMAALGAALIATGVGAAAGALMLAGAGLLLLSAINATVAAASEDGLGIAGSIAKASGADQKTIQDAEMGFGISLAIVSIAVAIAATVVSGGAAGPALIGALQHGLSIGSSAASIGGAAASVGSSVSNAVASVVRGEATEKQAQAKEMEAMMQQLDDLIDQALTMMMAANDRFNAIMDSVTEMAQEAGNTLSNTRFAG